MPGRSGTDIIRKQLDELMGKDRDGGIAESITVRCGGARYEDG